MPARIREETCASAAAGSVGSGETWSRKPAAVIAGLIASVRRTVSGAPSAPPTPINSRRFRNMSRMIIFGL
jgi:hypothetical protein